MSLMSEHMQGDRLGDLKQEGGIENGKQRGKSNRGTLHIRGE